MTNQRAVFISYSHVDKDFTNKFASLLLDFDIQIWKDTKDLQIGQEILESVYNAIKNTSHFCCIISSSSVKSTWVKEELSYAKLRRLDGSDIAIVPILIDEVEIPDYLKVYRVAHLEDRDLSLDNQEVAMTLRAFGVDLQEGPRILVNEKRKLLLNSCHYLRDRMVYFQGKLRVFQKHQEAYGKAKLVPQRIMVKQRSLRRRGFGLGSYRREHISHVPNPAYFKIKIERERIRSAFLDLRESASYLPAPIKKVKQALSVAGLSKSASKERLPSKEPFLWSALEDDLQAALVMSRTIGKVSNSAYGGDDDDDDDDAGKGKPNGLAWHDIDRWERFVSDSVANLDRIISRLAYWKRFDSDK